MAFDAVVYKATLYSPVVTIAGIIPYSFVGTAKAPTSFTATASYSDSFALQSTVPTPFLYCGFTFSQSAPIPTLTAEAFYDKHIVATVPIPLFSSNSVASLTGSVNITVLQPTILIRTSFGNLYSFSRTAPIPVPTIRSYEGTRFILSGSVRKPLLTSTAFSTAPFGVSVSVSKPIFTGYFLPPTLPIQTTTTSTIKDTWIINLATKYIGRYDNHRFNSYFRYNGAYYGCSVDGLFLLEGSTDNGTSISAYVQSGITDFGQREHKLIDDVYVYARTEDEFAINLLSNENVDTQNYIIPYDDNSGMHRRRVKTHKGVRGSSWQIFIQNQNGADINIGTVEVRTRYSKRSI